MPRQSDSIDSHLSAVDSTSAGVVAVNDKQNAVLGERGGKIDPPVHPDSTPQNPVSPNETVTVYLDSALRLVRFSPAAMELFKFTPSDAGRPLSTLSPAFHCPELVEDARAALAAFRTTDREVSAGGQHFLVRTLPCWTTDDCIGGVILTFLNITPRLQSETALRASEEEFRSLAEDVPLIVWTTRPDGWNTWFNQRWVEYTGLSMSESRGQGWLIPFHPEDKPLAAEAWRRAVEQNEPYSIECRLRRADGVYRWWLVRGAPRMSADGTILKWFGTCTDIEDLKQTGESLRLAHLRLHTVMNSISDGLAVLDKNWRYTYLNDQAAHIIGMSPDELLGNCVWDLFPAARGTGFEEGYRRAMTTGARVDLQAYYPHPINKWLECYCYPSNEGLTVYFHDITPRKDAEEMVRRNEDLFATLIEQAPLGMYVVNAEFRLQQVNSRALPAFGKIHPLIGRDFAEVMEYLWGPEVGGECTRIFRHTMETGEPYISPPFQNQRYDVELEQAVDWETQRVTLPDGRYGVACYFTDVTERRRHEAALEKAREAAETANASKDRFLAVLSHELRTPLTPVLMAVSALEREPDLPAWIRDDLMMIKRNVDLETKLIDDLLDLSRITSGKVNLKIEAVDLNEAVKEVCEICRPQTIESRVHIDTQLNGDTGLIAADPARLHQVLWNVIRNAVKFSPAEGTIHISTSRLSPDRSEIRVQDHGIGIPADVMPRIFHAFEQGDAHITRQFGGLGLGLAISRGLIDLHGGSIRAESAGPGQGTTFILEFPAKSASTGTTAPVPPPTGENAAGLLRLLLVEDHADTSRTLSRLLRRRGFEVTTAGDVAGATAAVQRDPFDLVISDLGLPDGTGYEVIRIVRAARNIPGIAMSGYGMEEDVRKSAAAGFTEHLVKPISLGPLLEAIHRVTGRQTG